MVNAVNGHGHGHVSNAFTQPNQPTAAEETAEPSQVQSHPGKGKAGAPGQVAKQMLGGTPPAGFSLGNLVSLIAHGDMDGAQNLVNSLAPPPAEQPDIVDESAEEILTPDTTAIDGTLVEGEEGAAVALLPDDIPEENVASEETAPIVSEDVNLNPDSSQESSLLDLFDTPDQVEETA